MIDKIISTLLVLSFFTTLIFVSFEMGKKKQCELDKNYLWSYDFGKCLKVGSDNIYGSLK